MFERLVEKFQVTNCHNADGEKHIPVPSVLSKVEGGVEFFSKFEGSSFNDSLYRVYQLLEIKQWTQIVESAFPSFKGKITCFAYDWIGRQFALDLNRILDNEPSLLMFDIGAGEILEISTSFQNFHNLIVDYPNEILALNFFTQWKNATGHQIKAHQCVGYRIPLFLNGEEEISNLEITDMKIYWELLGQIFNQVKKLPLGSKISSIKLQ